MPGVSRTLNVAYLDKASNGQEVEIDAEAVKIGKRLGEFLSYTWVKKEARGEVWESRHIC